MSVTSSWRHGLALLAAAILLAGWSVRADAISGVRFSPGGAITQTGIFRARDFASNVVVECPITLSGSFATSLVAIGEGSPVVGSITGLTSGTCTKGSIRVILNLPASLRLTTPTRTAAAGAISGGRLATNMGIRTTLSRGEECLLGFAELTEVTVEALGNNEYVWGRSFVVTLECSFIALGFFEVTAPSPRQVATFLPGNESITGFTPNPVVFGTVEVGVVAKRTVTIESVAGGRIEEIVVTSQRYFAITDPNGCRGRTLEAGGSCDINVLLSAPTESGRSVSDTLTVRIGETRYSGTLRAST